MLIVQNPHQNTSLHLLSQPPPSTCETSAGSRREEEGHRAGWLKLWHHIIMAPATLTLFQPAIFTQSQQKFDKIFDTGPAYWCC